MADSSVRIHVEGIDKIVKAFDKFPREISKYMSAAGKEAGENLLKLEGLQNYPPKGPWNEPPVPYYERGKGMITSMGISKRSEVLSKQWTVKRENFGAEIGNRASYAKYLHGETGQGRVYWATSHGWLALFTTAKRRVKQIQETFQLWTDKLIRDLDL